MMATCAPFARGARRRRTQPDEPWAGALAALADATGLPIGGDTEADVRAALVGGSMLYVYVCALGLGSAALSAALLEHVARTASGAEAAAEPIDLASSDGLERACAWIKALHEARAGQVVPPSAEPVATPPVARDPTPASGAAPARADADEPEPELDLDADAALLELPAEPTRIELVEHRTVTLAHLERIAAVVKARCRARRKWRTLGADGRRRVLVELDPDDVNLYHFVDTFTKPLTRAAAEGGRSSCSFAERLGVVDAAPHVFVSHWWGESILTTARCAADYAALRGLDAETTRFWICAHANDQHSVGLGARPSESPFARALRLSRYVLAVVDSSGEMLRRVWCGYETVCALETGGSERLAYDVVSRYGNETVLLAGTPLEGEDTATRLAREQRFSPRLAAEAIGFDLEQARASEERDKLAILAEVRARKDAVEATVRARYFLAALPVLGHSPRLLEAGADALARSELSEVIVDGARVDGGLPADWAAERLARSMPPSLDRLALADCALSGAALAACLRRAESAPLCELSLVRAHVRDAKLAELLCALLGHARSLRRLVLEGTRLDDEACTQLAALLRAPGAVLTSLDLTATTPTDEGVRLFGESAFAALGRAQLRSLHFGGLALDVLEAAGGEHRVAARGIPADCDIPAALFVRLLLQFGAELLQKGGAPLARPQHVAGSTTASPELDVTPAVLGDRLGAALASAALGRDSALTLLRLRDSKLGEESGKALGEALRHNTTLLTLDLRINELGDESAKALGEALRHNTTLLTLDLGRNRLSREGGTALSEALLHNATLHTLNLSSNHLWVDGKAFGEALLHNTTLLSLDLSHNMLGVNTGDAFDEALRHNATLHTLNLSDNALSEKGGRPLGEALRHNTALHTLDLSSNQMGKESALALGEALLHNTTLRTLNLRSNHITWEGGKALIQALLHNTVLHELNLSKNTLGEESGKLLGEVLWHSATLRMLDIEDCQLGAESAKALGEALLHNTTLHTLNLLHNPSLGAAGEQTVWRGWESSDRGEGALLRCKRTPVYSSDTSYDSSAYDSDCHY